MEYMKYIVILILSLVGIVNIVKSAILLLCKNNEVQWDILITLDDNCENPETTIRNTVRYHEWSDNSRSKYSSVYCIYKGKNKESKELCRRVCEEYPFTHYITDTNFLLF